MTLYTELIASQHRRPRFEALVAALTSPLVDLQILLEEMRGVFDLDTAVGVQLDATGAWIGRSRVLHTPLVGVYFAWGEAGVGWSQGMWRGHFDAETGLTSLSDDIYRRLLKAKVAANFWDGTTHGAYDVWEAAYGDTGSVIIIQDHMDMSISVGIAGMPLDVITKELLLQQYIPLKPEGVRASFYAVSVRPGPLFAWGVDNEGLAGWGKGQWPQLLKP